MKTDSEKIFLAISDAADLADEAAEYRPKKRRRWLTATALAACAALAVGLGAALIPQYGGTAPAPGDSSADSAGPEQLVGPVLPLTATGDLAGITAERSTRLDFSPYENGDTLFYKPYINVQDSYTLMNVSDSDRTLTVLYPFTGSFEELPECSLELDGEPLAAELLSGPYSGTFQEDLSDLWRLGTYALRDNSAYESALADGRYLREVLDGAPDLGEPVTVYEITAPWSEDRGAAPSICLTFSIDFSTVSFLDYRMNGGEYRREEGYARVGFFIPREGDSSFGATRYLIVRGGSVGPIEVGAYEDLGWDAGEEIEGGCEITSRETTLGEILDLIAGIALEDRIRSFDRDDDAEKSAALSANRDLILAELRRTFRTYGGGAYETSELYARGDCELTDAFNRVLQSDRIFYLRADITVPAEGSVTLTARLTRQATTYGYGESMYDMQSYSVSPSAGTALTFTSQTVTLANTSPVTFAGPADPPSGPIPLEDTLQVKVRRRDTKEVLCTGAASVDKGLWPLSTGRTCGNCPGKACGPFPDSFLPFCSAHGPEGRTLRKTKGNFFQGACP